MPRRDRDLKRPPQARGRLRRRGSGAVGALNPFNFERRRRKFGDLHDEAERPYCYESNRRLVRWIAVVMIIWIGLALTGLATEISQASILSRWRDQGFVTLPPQLSSTFGQAEIDALIRFAADNGVDCASAQQLTSIPPTPGCESVRTFSTELNGSEDQGSVVFAGLLFALVIGSVLVASFSYQANRNLLPLKSEEQRFGSTAAAVWLYVLGFNFFRGAQIFTELWKGSNPEVDPNDTSAWKRSQGSPLIPIWWFAFAAVLTIWLMRALGTFSGVTIDERITALNGVLLFSDLLLVVPAALGLIVMWRIHERQERRHRIVGPHLAVPRPKQTML